MEERVLVKYLKLLTLYTMVGSVYFELVKVTYLLDVVKTRLQMVPGYMGATRITWHILKDEGFRYLFSGFAPLFIDTSVGFYGDIKKLWEQPNKKIRLIYAKFRRQSAMCGLVSGAVAQFLASPTDLVKVQMQAKGKRRFWNSYYVFIAVYKSNGVIGLWTGWLPNTQRAALLNMADLATYDRTKHWLITKDYLDNYYIHFIASLVSGIAAAIISTPADVVKTRIMVQLRNIDKKSLLQDASGTKDLMIAYNGFIEMRVFFALYRGFVPLYIRSTPWSLVFWMTYEQIRNMFDISGF